MEGALVSSQYKDRTTTGADGSFLLLARSEDEIWLRAEKEGSGDGKTELLQPPASGVEIRLVRGISLTGRLLGLEPEELAQATLELWSPDLPSRQVVVDPQGRYRILDLVAGEWTASISAGQRTLGEPLAGVEVIFYCRGHSPIWTETGEDGTFSARLEDGDYSVTASLDGYFGGNLLFFLWAMTTTGYRIEVTDRMSNERVLVREVELDGDVELTSALSSPLR